MATLQPDVNDDDDYSPSSTTITFNPPLPLLRNPIPFSSSSPSSPFILAFKDADSFSTACKSCLSTLTSQCEAGARIGCAIAASDKCKTPWWKSPFSKPDLAERERCEERETRVCVEAAKARCEKFAKEKCVPVFGEARVAGRKVDWKEASKLMFWAVAAERGLGFGFGLDRMGSWAEIRDRVEVTSYRGSDILGTVISE
ncbi:hypothetical protein RHSIM_Rhsim13G0029700 [Rhododendron simsii]|uniref:Uncharacterized protein n=1 Tax=Rhododendron simsii TaxID=118357 RepID=A0A834L4V5_RHOSS|nr:hypothetical protein RHSIM_Rhsim13G0029700 [Rhododendron simsii]